MEGTIFGRRSTRTVVMFLSLFVFGAFPSRAFLSADEGEARKTSPALPVVLNMVPGFGLGSFLTGDPGGGAIQAAGELLGAGLAGLGLIMAEGTVEDGDCNENLVGALVISGAALWLGSKIFGVLRPISRLRDRSANRGTQPLITTACAREGVILRPQS
jgi:hypothetical protein